MTIDPKFVAMIKRQNYVVIDVETTGKERFDTICQIAITTPDNDILMRENINPRRPISHEASRIHGIVDDDVKDCPDWATISQRVIEIIQGKDVVIFNAKHERMLFHQSDEQAGLPKANWRDIGTWWCAMEFYAEVWGEPNEKYANAKWQSLKSATTQQGLDGGMFHSALADCFMTNNLVRFIATQPEKVKTFATANPEPKPTEITHEVKHISVANFDDTAHIAQLLSLGWGFSGSFWLPIDSDGKLTPVIQVFLTRKLPN